MSTDISGNLTYEQIKEAGEKAREALHCDVMRCIDGNPAPHEVDVLYPEKSAFDERGPTHHYIDLGLRFRGNAADFIGYVREENRESVERLFQRSQRITGHPVRFWVNTSAMLFPQHRLALVVGFDYRYIPDADAKLTELGYTIISKPEKHYSTQWGNETKTDVLSMLRGANGLRALDARGLEIVRSLMTSFGDYAKDLTFAAYKPKKKLMVPGGDFGEIMVESTESKETPDHIISEHTFPIAEVESSLEKLCKGLPMTRAIAITSKVNTKEGVRHIPMIGFGYGNPYVVLNETGMNGILVNSGNSQHFCGFKLLDQEDWEAFMEKLYGLTISGVDRYWAPQQLKQGFSTLRITPMRTNLTQPCFVQFYNPSNNQEMHSRVEEMRDIFRMMAG